MTMVSISPAPEIERRHRYASTHDEILYGSLELVKRSSYHIRRSALSMRSADRALSRAALRLYDSLQLLATHSAALDCPERFDENFAYLPALTRGDFVKRVV